MAVKEVKLKTYQTELLDAAAKAMENPYNPYSHFSVGAALLATDGSIIIGANFENASYGGTICAERAALVNANAAGIREFKAIAIIARGKDFETEEPTAPCGFCRQLLFEASQVSNTNLEVIMANTDRSKVFVWKINDLLPLAFGPKDLGVDLKKYRRGTKTQQVVIEPEHHAQVAHVSEAKDRNELWTELMRVSRDLMPA